MLSRYFVAVALVVCAVSLTEVSAFYLPGVVPKQYADGDSIDLKVNKLTSVKTQLPLDYYTTLNYCPPDQIVHFAENLGEVLRGDRIQNSPYELTMGKDEMCKILCVRSVDSDDLAAFREKIQDDYRVNWIVDNLPVVNQIAPTLYDNDESMFFDRGFPVGRVGSPQHAKDKEGDLYLHNHVRLSIYFHKEVQYQGSRIVGFRAEPFSVDHKPKEDGKGGWIIDGCQPNSLKRIIGGPGNNELPLSMTEPVTEGHIAFTYDVSFQQSDVKWASRWDMYLSTSDKQIHWFSIINSLLIVIFLTGMVAMIMMRTLHQDIGRYDQQDQEEAQEETGWKLVHGDVFRPPTYYGIFSVVIGTGAQLFLITLVTMVFAMLGFLSPANRGALMTAMLLLFVFCGIFSGYTSSRMYKMFKGQAWKRTTLATAILYPTFLGVTFFLLDLVAWYEQSSAAIPFSTMLAIFSLWCFISIPLVFLGSMLGFRSAPIEHPVRTNQIPRQIPDQPYYMRPLFSCLVGGVLPFGAVFIELFFILSSIWLHQYYYVFGFLFIVFLILVATCAEITIVMCYFQLCSEDYHWWWRSFFTAGSSGFYLFLYSIFYFYSKLEVTRFTSTILYFGYMFVVSVTFAVLTGTIGYYSCLYFIRRIYSSVKVD